MGVITGPANAVSNERTDVFHYRGTVRSPKGVELGLGTCNVVLGHATERKKTCKLVDK